MKKPPEQMTDDEIRMVKEIEKKEEAIVEEREKYKKVSIEAFITYAIKSYFIA